MGEGVDELLEKYKRELILALSGLVLVGMGVWWWRKGGQEMQVEVVHETGEVREVNETAGGEFLAVDVGGAVVKAGVYELGSGSRVQAAIDAAGGLAETADEEWVERYLNRSELVQDGMKIYVPRANETMEVEMGRGESGRINVNTASQAELVGLPGVGPVTAGKIISGRPYGRAEELMGRKIVSGKVWEQIQALVSVW